MRCAEKADENAAKEFSDYPAGEFVSQAGIVAAGVRLAGR